MVDNYMGCQEMDKSVKKELSRLLYQLFVTNTYAMAFQRDDGKYTTKYLPVSSFVIACK